MNSPNDALIDELMSSPNASPMFPYVMLAYGSQNIYWWRDDNHILHEIAQGEGDE